MRNKKIPDSLDMNVNGAFYRLLKTSRHYAKNGKILDLLDRYVAFCRLFFIYTIESQCD